MKNAIVGSLGDASYERTDLLQAKKQYETVLGNYTGSTLLEADTLYNLGNTLYKLSELENDSEKQIALLKESIGSYTRSLSLRTDEQTEDNLAFVKEKLKKEETKQQEKIEEQEKEEEQKSRSGAESTSQTGAKNEDSEGTPKDGGTEKSESGTETSSGTESTASTGAVSPKPGKQNWSNGGAYNPIGTGSLGTDSSKPLSDTEKEEVEQYLESLKRFEKQNGKLLNPDKVTGVPSISDQIRNFFGNDSFFQDALPTNDGKKDW